MRRAYQHKSGLVEGFTKKYNVKLLVYYEHSENIDAAISREKVIKKWKRKYKIDAIERMNPEWKDLYFDLIA
jgi:putative endonuclease